MKVIRLIPVAIMCFLLLNISAFAQHQEHGKVDFEVSCNDQARQHFEDGLALMHHMMYEQAEERFQKAASADSECAMAHWGIAMTVIHPLWGERPADEQLQKGKEAVETAKNLAPPTQRESDYISALEPFFSDWEKTTYPEQLGAFESGFQTLHNNYPDDVDAAAFYALGQLATAPKDDPEFSKQSDAGQLLENYHSSFPDHPGLFHYIIHAYDNRVLAEKAVDVAREYDKVAPDVPHALHMPSHIFVRLGYWDDVVDWNRRSADAALRQPVNGQVSMHYVHALDYEMYAYLQQGEDEKATEVKSKVEELDNLQSNLAAAYALATIQARHFLELADWEQVAEIEPRSFKGIHWEQYPGAESISWFARGLGAARTGDIEAADESIRNMDQLYDKLIEAEESYWAVLTDAQRTAVRAWVEYEKGKPDKALELMQKAADLEDSVDKHPVTPGHALPARELLGEMYLMENMPVEALAAYEKSLDNSANRFNALYGAGRSAELAGNSDTAKSYYTTLVKNCPGDVTRAHFTAANEYLATHE